MMSISAMLCSTGSKSRNLDEMNMKAPRSSFLYCRASRCIQGSPMLLITRVSPLKHTTLFMTAVGIAAAAVAGRRTEQHMQHSRRLVVPAVDHPSDYNTVDSTAGSIAYNHKRQQQGL